MDVLHYSTSNAVTQSNMPQDNVQFLPQIFVEGWKEQGTDNKGMRDFLLR